MNTESIREYCLSRKGATESFPFDEHTLVFKVMGKMFALMPLEYEEIRINLKCDPDRAVELREEFPEWILPGYYSNKKHWNTIRVEPAFPRDLLLQLIDHSYERVVAGLTRKLKAELEERAG